MTEFENIADSNSPAYADGYLPGIVPENLSATVVG